MTQRITDIEAKATAARYIRRMKTGKPTIHMVDGRWVIYTGFNRLSPWERHAWISWRAQQELRQRQSAWRKDKNI
jgi:hypothetical protein